MAYETVDSSQWAPSPPLGAARSQCLTLSTTGPSKGIADIHFPMRERAGSSRLSASALAGDAESGMDSGGTG